MKGAHHIPSLELHSNKYRQSLSLLSSELARNSLSTTSSTSFLHRQCLGACSKIRKTVGWEMMQYLRLKLQQQFQEKENDTFSNLKSTLTELQKKITQAKKQFKNSEKVDVSLNLLDQTLKKSSGNDKTLTFSADLNTTLSSQGRLHNSINEINTGCQTLKTKGYYLNNLPSVLEGNDIRALDHMNFSLKVLKNSSKFSSLTFADLEQKKVYIPRTKENIGKKTLILDIDETLIHCEEDPSKPYDIVIPIQVQNGSMANAYITIRPYAISFLKRMSKLYEIIAFTASHESYADAVLDQIDPQREYIKHRLYRKNCVEVYEKIYTKDLRIINRDLGSMVLVDNAPYSYLFQLQNGIPILPYFTGEDVQLIQLEKYLQEMAKCKDVREFNKKHFQLHKYINFEDSEELIKELYL